MVLGGEKAYCRSKRLADHFLLMTRRLVWLKQMILTSNLAECQCSKSVTVDSQRNSVGEMPGGHARIARHSLVKRGCMRLRDHAQQLTAMSTQPEVRVDASVHTTRQTG